MAIKLLGFDPNFVTRKFFSNQYPSDINCGECFKWAYICHLLYKDVHIWFNDYHAFVKYNGRFYDAERPNGVRDWVDLPSAEGCSCKNKFCRVVGGLHAKKSNVINFKDVWGNKWKQPQRFGFTWNEVERMAKKVIREQNK